MIVQRLSIAPPTLEIQVPEVGIDLKLPSTSR